MNEKTASSGGPLRRYGIAALVFVALAALLGWLVAPAGLAVEVAAVSVGPLEVTVEQQGEVRMHDRYNVTAPIAGSLARIELHQGDAVKAGATVATLRVAPLDPRQREEAGARLASARGLVREAEATLDRARNELAMATRDRQRAEQLVEKKFISSEAAERSRTAEESQRRGVRAAEARVEAAQADVRAAQAVLLGAGEGDRRAAQDVPLKAPATGTVLRLIEQSERTLPAGTVVMVIGDPRKVEIVADVLSTDAVRIRPGAPVRIEGWGGAEPLAAVVRTVEPYAYTKVSALGVEEKRVDVVMDPVGSLGALGDGYRVETRIVVWSAPSVARVPIAALFRCGESWCVYRVTDGRSRATPVKIGERNARHAVLTEGLEAGAMVILYPPNGLADGAMVRTTGAN